MKCDRSPKRDKFIWRVAQAIGRVSAVLQTRGFDKAAADAKAGELVMSAVYDGRDWENLADRL